MAYTISNPSAGNAYFRNNGNAINATTQPQVDSSVIAGVLDSSLTANQTDYGLVSNTIYESYTGFDDISILRTYTTQYRDKTVTKTAIQIPGSDFNRPSINDLAHMRTNRVATAIRAGFWNPTTGGFSTLPTSADDISAFGVDDEALSNKAAPGEFAFSYHKTITQKDYPARTQ